MRSDKKSTGFWTSFEVDCADYGLSYERYLEKHSQNGFTSNPLPEPSYLDLVELISNHFEYRRKEGNL